MRSRDAAPRPGTIDFLTGGEMGVVMRAHDWSATPLGDPETWPQSLRSTVGLMLANRHLMFVAWGPELAFLYNDGYRPVLGAKHPRALGRPFREVWPEIWGDIEPLIDSALAGEATWSENLHLVMERNGYPEDCWFTFSYSPVRDESGRVVGLFCAGAETTQAVLAEREKAAERERLARMFEQAPGFITILQGPEHRFEFANAAYRGLFGDRGYVGRTAREVFPDLEDQGFFELLDRVYSTGERFVADHIPVRLERSPGGSVDERFLNFIYEPVADESGRITGIFCEGHDVTDTHRAEAELRATSRRLDAIINNTMMAIFVMDDRQHCVFMNKAAEALTGYTIEETKGRPLHDVVHHRRPDGSRYPLEECPIDRAFPERNQMKGEEIFVHKDGSFYPVAFTASPIRGDGGEPIGTIIEARGIAEEKAGQAALRATEAKFQAIVNSIDQMIWSTRSDGYHDYYNDRWYEFTGVGDGSTDGEGWNDMFHPDDQDRAWSAWRHALTTGEPYHIEYRLRHRSGQYRWVIGRAHPVRDEAGIITRWYGTCTDIHDLKHAEAELQRTSALLGLIGDSAPDMIYAKDRDSRVLYANASASRIIGRPLTEIVGHTDYDWATNADEAAAIIANDVRVIEAGETLDIDEAFTSPSGEVRHYRSVKSPLRDATGAIIGLVGITSDVTERRQALERERLLAREVDHRAKNMLAVVQSVVQLTRADDIASFATAISGRIQSLARAHSLLAASRWEGADLRQLVSEELAPFTSRDTSLVQISGPAIRLKPEAAQSLALVVHELATNAAKYGSLSAAGGELLIGWAIAADGSRLDLRWQERGGPAVATPTRRGFGSTVMRASVERQLKGTVSLDWDPAGLVCDVTLPAEQLVATGARKTVSRPAKGRPAAMPHLQMEGRRVLVLEDEALIAMQIEDALNAIGCLVVGPATRVPEAFDLIYAADVDAALLDINVAGERSFAVADILASKGTPFAFVTGFDAASTVPERFHGVPVIAKPFETAKLMAIVERLSSGG